MEKIQDNLCEILLVEETGAMQEEYVQKSYTKIKVELYLSKYLTDLNYKQHSAILSLDDQKLLSSSQINNSNYKKNNILEGYITIGCLKEIRIQNIQIIPNNIVIQEIEPIQALIVEEPEQIYKYKVGLNKSFILFLQFLKNYRNLPLNIVKNIYFFSLTPPNTLFDIGTKKQVYIGMQNRDERNLIKVKDKFLISKTVEMTIVSMESISDIMKNQDIERTFLNIQTFIKNHFHDLIGLTEEQNYLLYQALLAQSEEQFQIFIFFISQLIEKPLLILKLQYSQQIKYLKIIGTQSIHQFGSSELILPQNKIQFPDIDNFQFYIQFNQGKWYIYDGRYAPQYEQFYSKYGTWKLLGNEYKQLQDNETIRIGNSYLQINQKTNKNPLKYFANRADIINKIKQDDQYQILTIQNQQQVKYKYTYDYQLYQSHENDNNNICNNYLQYQEVEYQGFKNKFDSQIQ